MSSDRIDAYDIGVNLLSRKFGSLDEVIKYARQNGVGFISISNNLAESKRNLRQAAKYGYKMTAGVHPHNAKQFGRRQQKELARILANDDSSIVAVGECGLDYDRNFSSHGQQQVCFRQQIGLAKQHNLPLYLHVRNGPRSNTAHEDFVSIMQEEKYFHGVVHCFTGDKNALLTYLKMGLYIGITGIICHRGRGEHLRKLIPLIPADKLLIETDAPFMNYFNNGDSVSHPVDVFRVASKIAQILQKSCEEILQQTKENSMKLFAMQ